MPDLTCRNTPSIFTCILHDAFGRGNKLNADLTNAQNRKLKYHFTEFLAELRKYLHLHQFQITNSSIKPALKKRNKQLLHTQASES